jgi:hypothetical protein
MDRVDAVSAVADDGGFCRRPLPLLGLLGPLGPLCPLGAQARSHSLLLNRSINRFAGRG